MDLTQITPLILTFNEKENIGRTLSALSWATEIVIIDSGSMDGTPEIARSAHPNVRIVTRPFDNHTAQWNFGLAQIGTPWVLSLDADYFVGQEFITELGSLNPADDVSGYSATFQYCIEGVPLRASVYPPRVVLFRRDRSRYREDGHTQILETRGRVIPLSSTILHDDRKPFRRWFREQKRYSKIEARHLLSQPFAQLNVQDRLRQMIFFAVPTMFFYLLFIRGLILDGWRGWYYVFQRTLAEFLLAIQLIVERLKR